MALISDLPLDVLASILGRLCLRDYIRCRAVCSDWNSTVSWNPNPRQVPWLSLTRTEADEANEICRFYDFYHGVELTVAIPGVRWRRCMGSSDGWLMILDEFSELSMFNPLTGVRIALPSITTFPDVEPVFDSSGRVSHYRFINFQPLFILTADETCDYYYRKATVTWTSDSLYTVVVLCGGYSRLFAFARPGDEAWTLVNMDESFPFEDVIFNESRFSMPGRLRGVPADLFSTAGVRGPYDCVTSYVVKISGNFFEVFRLIDLYWRTTSFGVYMIDDADKWVAVKSLGGYALFLDDNYFIAVSKRDFPALKENCIYFTNCHWEAIYLAVFSLEDRSIEFLYMNGPPQTYTYSQPSDLEDLEESPSDLEDVEESPSYMNGPQQTCSQPSDLEDLEDLEESPSVLEDVEESPNDLEDLEESPSDLKQTSSYMNGPQQTCSQPSDLEDLEDLEESPSDLEDLEESPSDLQQTPSWFVPNLSRMRVTHKM